MKYPLGMEIVDNATMLLVNRWLIARGKGHAVVHETGVHGRLPPRVVGIAAVAAFAFATIVLAADLLAVIGTRLRQAAAIARRTRTG